MPIRADTATIVCVMATVLRELDHCIFCGDGDMTEEHLIADWAHRAFAKKRKPDGLLRMRIVGRLSGSSWNFETAIL